MKHQLIKITHWFTGFWAVASFTIMDISGANWNPEKSPAAAVLTTIWRLV